MTHRHVYEVQVLWFVAGLPWWCRSDELGVMRGLPWLEEYLDKVDDLLEPLVLHDFLILALGYVGFCRLFLKFIEFCQAFPRFTLL